MSKKDKKQLDGVDFLTVYLYVDSLRREDIKLLKEEVKRLTELTKWQPIETAPNDESGWVLIYGKHPFYGTDEISFGEYSEDKKVYIDLTGQNIIATHWMPLPKPPTN